jgi:hypothetical protein
VERGVLPRPEIRRRLAEFVLVRLWTNDRDPAARSPEWRALLEERFGTSAIPLYAALDPDGRTLGSTGFAGGGADAFTPLLARFLDEALAKAAPK